MDSDYRYKLETPHVTGRRQQKFACPHCGRKRCFVRYVDTRNGNQYVAESGCYEKWQRRMELTTGIDYNVSRQLEAYPPNTDLGDLLLSEGES